MSTLDQPLSGRIESLRFEALLAQFWLQGFSGSFRSRGCAGNAPFASKEVLLDRGRIAWAASDDSQDSIRSHLIQRGIIRSEQWRLAQERSGPAHPRQALVDMGFLTARELHDADRDRVCGIVLGLFNWVEGDYAVSPSPLPPGTPNLQVDPRDLVLEGIMASGDRDRVLETIGSLDAVLVVRPDDLARASLSLPVELVALMEKADGTRSVSEICALSPLQDFMICAALAGLKVLGLATAAEGGARAAPPAPPRSPAPPRATRRPPRLVESAVPAGTLDAHRPRLPLEGGDEGATPPLAATHQEGIPTTHPDPGTGLDDEDDSGTVPMSVTPSGGSPAVHDDAGEMLEDPGTRPMTATPPGGTPTVRDEQEQAAFADHTSGDGEGSGFDPGEAPTREISELAREVIEGEAEREGETEIAPGIPVPSGDRAGRDLGLLADEIESVVQIFSSEDRHGAPDGDPQAPPPPAQPMDRLHPPAADPWGGSQDASAEDPLTLPEDASIGDPETDPETAPGLDPGLEDSPTWVYEPSGEMPVQRGYAPWVKWAGMAAGLFAVGTIVTLFFGAGTAETTPTPAAEREVAGPPSVDVPASPGGDEPAPEPASPIPQPAERQAPAAADSPGPRMASAGAEAAPGGASLATPDDGDILRSSPFRNARSLLAAGRLREAASGFQASLAGRRGLYTVQLALACSPETVARASRSTGGAVEFYILPKEFDGRACYRLLWGAYPGRKGAESARSSVPSSFRQGRDAPFVAPI